MNRFESAPLLPINRPEIEMPNKSPTELVTSAFAFLGDQHEMIDPSVIESVAIKAETFRETIRSEILQEDISKKKISYDKRKKSFFVNEQPVSMGTIVASRHWGNKVTIPEDLDQYGDGKRLRKTYVSRAADDVMFGELNYALADTLAEKMLSKDLLKSEAYKHIRDRSRETNVEKKTGVIAEKIMIGFIESISIDRPDLGISVTPANAYQDVEQKIDFVIHRKNQKRGVGVEAVDPIETTIGIQFTTDTRRETHTRKMEQITKSKERGLDVDDIIYVAIDMKTLEGAIAKWNDADKPIHGPMEYLHPDIKKKAVQELFKNLLTDEQVAKLKV